MKLMIGLIIIAICLGAALIMLMTGCSSDSIRQGNKPADVIPMSRDQERQRIVDQGKAFCDTYKDDLACKGPKR
jgi:hypothetical protein